MHHDARPRRRTPPAGPRRVRARADSHGAHCGLRHTLGYRHLTHRQERSALPADADPRGTPCGRRSSTWPTRSTTVTRVIPDREGVVWGDRRLTFGAAGRPQPPAGRLPAQSRGLGVHTERTELAGHESGQDHLGIYLYNGNEYLEAMLGAFMARVAPFNVNYRYVADELLYLLDNARLPGARVPRRVRPRRWPRCSTACRGSRCSCRSPTTRATSCCPAPSTTRRCCADTEPDGRRRALAPTTSTSSTRAARPACPRACCGASTTSSCRHGRPEHPHAGEGRDLRRARGRRPPPSPSPSSS